MVAGTPTQVRLQVSLAAVPVRAFTAQARKDGALAGTFSIQYAPVDGPRLVLQFGEVGQPGVAAQVARGIDDGLDPHRAAALEVLLDPEALVEDVDHGSVMLRTD